VAARVGNGTGRGATLICGDTCTLTGIVLDIGGGAVTIKTATASGDIDIHSGGTLIVEGTGAHADIDVQNGLCDYRSSGTITTLAVRSAGKFTKENDYRANTITNVVQAFKNANIQDPNKALTLTAGFKLNGCTLDDVDFNFGTDRTYTVA
jgi:hypothetical protein